MFKKADDGTDNLYLDISIVNNSSNNTTPAVFSASYNQPILDDPSQYYMAVVKFSIPLQSLPLFVMPLMTTEQRNLSASTGTVTQVGLNVVGTGTTFNSFMVGGTLSHSGGSTVITSVQNSNRLTTAGVLVALNSSFSITYSLPLSTLINQSNLVIGVCENNQPGSKNGLSPFTPIPSFTENVIYVPQNQYIQVGDIRYPYVYSYEIFTLSLSIALNSAWIKAGSPGGVTGRPFLSFDPETELINIYMPASFVNAGANGWTICMNNILQQYFPSYPYFLSNDPAFVNGRFEINTNQFAGLGLGPPNPGYDPWFQVGYPSAVVAPQLFQISQEYQTVDYLNSVRKIIIVSNTLPVQKEYYPPPNTINSGQSNTIPIISDFQLDLANQAGSQRSVALYDAIKYRLIDMISNSPLHKVDIQIFWADQNNNLYPVFLTQNDTATLKLGFFSKKTSLN